MRLHARAFTLVHSEPFVISRSADTESEVVQVAIEHDGVVGYGEGAPDSRYREGVAGALAALAAMGEHLGDDPFAVEAILDRVARAVPGEMAARCALDGALHDLVGKLCGQPLWRLLGLSADAPATSYTISIDTVEGTRDRARRAAGYRALKIKVGGPDDLDRVRAVREEAAAAAIRVDANEAWSVDDALGLAQELERLGVELVEQPLHADDVAGYRRLRDERLPVPVVLDESCHTLGDVATCAALGDGVNIKLTKSGGIREALRMVHAARALGLTVMLGCMNESSLGIAGAAQIAPLVDVCDLDGHLLNANDAFSGLRLVDGAVLPSAEPGLGVAPLDAWP